MHRPYSEKKMSASAPRSVVLKLDRGGDTRRLRVDPTKETFATLAAHVSAAFEGATLKRASYVDDEGDRVQVTRDLELAEAFQFVLIDGDGTTPARKSLRLEIETVDKQGDVGDLKKTAAQKKPEETAQKKPAATARATPVVRYKTSNEKVKERVEWRKKAAAKKVSLTSGDSPSQPPSKTNKVADKPKAAAAKPGPDQDEHVGKPSKPVPLETLSGAAKIFLDGTVEHGLLCGDAQLLPGGRVSCMLRNATAMQTFPTVGAQGVALVSGKWYYECTLLTDGCMQIGWATPSFVGHAERGEGVGDCVFSWAYDGYRRKRWHAGSDEHFGPKWAAGQTVCCALDVDQGVMRFALNGRWDTPESNSKDEAFRNLSAVLSERGVFPAVSFSKFEKCRLNFGAPGTPLKYGPPDDTFKTVWESYGTTAANTRNACTHARPTFTNTSKTSSSSLPSKRTKTAAKQKFRHTSSQRSSSASGISEAQQQLAALVLQPEVRIALSQALSKPAVAETIQAVLGAAIIEGKAGARRCFLEKLPTLIPIATSLVAERPELLAVIAQLYAILREEGVVRGGCGGDAFFPLVTSLFGMGGQSIAGNFCQRQAFDGCPSGGAPGRASRDTDWRAHLGEGIKTLSAKFAEAAAATSVAASTAVDAAAESVGISSPVTSHGRKKMEQSQVAAAIEASKRDKEELDLRKAVNASLEAMAAASSADTNAPEDAPHSITDNRSAVRGIRSEKKTKNKSSDTGGESKTTEIEKPRARFLKDVAPRKTALSPGQPFTHSWRLCNSGQHPWGAVTAKCTGGDPLLGCDSVVTIDSGVAPGEVVDIEVALVAPTQDGRYISYWRLHDDASGTKFGDRIWVDVSVNTEDSVESDTMLGNAADSSLAEAEAERGEENNPFVDAVAAEPILKGLAGDGQVEDQDHTSMDCDENASSSSDAGSDAVPTSAVVPEEPDWLEVGNSLLAMSQSEGKPEASAMTSDPAVIERVEETQSSKLEASSPLLEKIVSMGFSDTEKVRMAVAASDGDIQAAVSMLVAGQ